MQIIKVKSGIKEFKLDHLAMYNFKKQTGTDILSRSIDLELGKIELEGICDIFLVGTDYVDMEEMLEDLDFRIDIEPKAGIFGGLKGYVEAIGKEMGLFFGGETENMPQNKEEKIRIQAEERKAKAGQKS